jgi:BirA family biotin operon repressor/biotin-[acetyl-CoA-carboxylase] ligase
MLRAGALRSAVLVPGSIWSSIDVVAQTGSTNEDLLAAARSGASEGAVLVAERQTRGRGRRGRSWVSQPGAALTFSVLLRPARVPRQALGWLPLLTGVALARALRAGTGVDVALKWPNDVLAGGAKLAGILAEQAGEAVVVGIGINVSARQDELPLGGPTSLASTTSLAPTSLALHDASSTDRAALLAGILRELQYWYLRWTTDPGDSGDPDSSGLRTEYLRWCSTIGRDVRVLLPGGPATGDTATGDTATGDTATGGTVLSGVAAGIDSFGRLIIDAPAGRVPVSAGDVLHVR